MAQCFGHCEASHSDRLASNRLPLRLALEVEADWKATDFSRSQRIDPPHVSRKPDLG